MSVNFVNIPTELKQNASFCLWKKEKRGGRVTKESVIDLSVGVILNKKVADRVELDEALGVIHAQTMEKAQEAAQLLKNCYTIVDEPVEKSKFIKGIVK